jgi:hypothetical protein
LINNIIFYYCPPDHGIHPKNLIKSPKLSDFAPLWPASAVTEKSRAADCMNHLGRFAPVVVGSLAVGQLAVVVEIVVVVALGEDYGNRRMIFAAINFLLL